MRQVISAHIFEPHTALFKENRKDASYCRTVHCENSANCDLYKRGECALIRVLGGVSCPYGNLSRETGPTPRARAYLTWISERKTKHKDVLNKVGSYKDVLGMIGDYVFLPYSWIRGNEKVKFTQAAGFLDTSGGLIKKDDFTVDAVFEIASYRPQALMGGEIRDYQTKEVPKFLKHLSEKMPELFDAFLAKHPAYERFRKTTNVGRKAVLSSLNTNVGQFKDIHSGLWTWDGTYLTSTNSRASFMLTSKFSELRLKVDGKVEVVITDDLQVNDKTVFLD